MSRILIILAALLCASSALAAASLDLTTPVVAKVIRKIQVSGVQLYTVDGQSAARVALSLVGSGKGYGDVILQITDTAGTCSVLQRSADGSDVELLQAQLGTGVLTGLLDAIRSVGRGKNQAAQDAAVLNYLVSAGVIAANLAGTVN